MQGARAHVLSSYVAPPEAGSWALVLLETHPAVFSRPPRRCTSATRAEVASEYLSRGAVRQSAAASQRRQAH
eukprot:scaffold42852_cov29-Tisochrysis_lutea.AAC.1